MLAYPKYESYKETDVPWIGEIPKGWEIKPGFTVLKENKVKNKGMIEEVVLSLSYGKVVIKPIEKLTGLVPESFETYQIIEPGDIIFRPTDLQNDVTSLRTGLAKDNGIITSAYISLKLKGAVNAVYIHYLLHVYDLMKVFYGLGSGLRQNISYIDFKRLPIVVPDEETQIRIANFLDLKTKEIDETIVKNQQLIALLKEQKAILINQAVTKGLNPDAPMRDSGVEWIGEIPEHWEIKKNRELFEERKEPGRESLPILSVSLHTGVSTEQQSGEKNIRAKIRIEDKTSYKFVEVGDVVFNMMRAWQGAIGAVKVLGMVSPAYIVANPKGDFNGEYFECLYRTGKFIGEMDRYSKGITDFRKRLYWDEFKQLNTVVPPVDEQKKISAHIQRLNDDHVGLKASLMNEIELLNEFRRTLISNVVTGKIKV